MHVAICSDGVFPASMGGIERHTRLLVESIAERHPSTKLTVLHTHPGKRFFERYANVTEVEIPPKPGKRQYLLECIDMSGRFAEALRKLPNAVVYSQGVCVLKGIHQFTPRLIVNPHGLESFQALGVRAWATTTPFRIVQRRTLRHARFVISLGGRLTRILEREVGDRDRIVVLPNGVNVPATSPARAARQGGPLRLLFVGRLARNKGVPDLLKAMDTLNRQGLQGLVSLEIAGTGPLLESLSRDYRALNVNFLGKVSDEQLEVLYQRADALVLPTLFEGMPTVVLEAMARALPVLVTDVGATTELVDDSNGRIIQRRNPGGLAREILRLAQLAPNELLTLGHAGLSRVRERFTWAHVADSHVNLFKRVHAEAIDTP